MSVLIFEFSGRGHEQHALLFPVTHGLLTEGEKWFSLLSTPVKDRVPSASSPLLPPLLLSLSQTSSHCLPDPVTAASVWVAIWLKLCSATEVGPLRCTHVVSFAVNNFCYYCCCLQVTVVIVKEEDGLSAWLFQACSFLARHDDNTATRGIGCWLCSSWMHLAFSC